MCKILIFCQLKKLSLGLLNIGWVINFYTIASQFFEYFVYLYRYFAEHTSYNRLNLSVIETANDGKPELAPDRAAKRDSAIADVYKRKNLPCEQYALKVRIAGWYPVLKQGEKVATDSIWLNKDEIWRFGKAKGGEVKRYPTGVYYRDEYWLLSKTNMYYETQFVGDEIECLAEEKRKIYNYPTLPECIRRNRKLIRPAGNKNDN